MRSGACSLLTPPLLFIYLGAAAQFISLSGRATYLAARYVETEAEPKATGSPHAGSASRTRASLASMPADGCLVSVQHRAICGKLPPGSQLRGRLCRVTVLLGQFLPSIGATQAFVRGGQAVAPRQGQGPTDSSLLEAQHKLEH